MPSRMDKYYNSGEVVGKRSRKNEELYKSIYEDVEYTNVEGISIIEKDESIDINKIKELLNKDKSEPKKPFDIRNVNIQEEEEVEEEKNYDIKDVLDKAKSERGETNKLSNTQYNILKNLNLDQTVNDMKTIDDEELRNMIDSITQTSKLNQTGDLLDDLKTIHDPKLKEQVEEMDNSFFTSSMNFKKEDFEDLKDIKDEVKKNNILVKVLIFIFLAIVIAGVIFAGYHFLNN